MSRYIDTDALAQKVVINGDVDFINKVTKLMIDAPSIDIVRCKECKYYNNDYTGEWCGRFRDPHPCRADGFCSYGKVSEKPTGSEREGE